MKRKDLTVQRELHTSKPRVRGQGHVDANVITNYTIVFHNPSGGSTLSGDTGNAPGFSGVSNTCYDTITAGYRSVISHGGIINNDVDVYKADCVTPTDVCSSQNIPDVDGSFISRTFSGNNVPFMTQSPLCRKGFDPNTNKGVGTDLLLCDEGGTYSRSLESAITMVAIHARQKVTPPDTLALVTAAEFGKTFSLLAETAAKLVKGYEAIRSGKPGSAIAQIFGNPSPRRRTFLDDKRYAVLDHGGYRILGLPRYNVHLPRGTLRVGDIVSKVDKAWLEYRYGWGPLLMDMVSTCVALDRSFDRGYDKRKVARSQVNDVLQYISPRILRDRDRPQQLGGDTNFTIAATGKRVVKGYILYQFDKTRLNTSFAAFGITAIPETIWELIPFSFVADWFIPFGDWISALTPKIGVTVLASGYSVKDKKIISNSVTGWVPTVAPVGMWPDPPFHNGQEVASIERYYRRTNLPIPLYPPLNVQLNKKRVLDAITLITSGRSSTTRI